MLQKLNIIFIIFPIIFLITCSIQMNTPNVDPHVITTNCSDNNSFPTFNGYKLHYPKYPEKCFNKTQRIIKIIGSDSLQDNIKSIYVYYYDKDNILSYWEIDINADGKIDKRCNYTLINESPISCCDATWWPFNPWRCSN